MKLFLTLSFASFYLICNSQTAIIAHKNHSGSSESFFTSPGSNFGDPPMERYPIYKPLNTEIFTPLNDSVIILEVKDIHENTIRIDTLKNENKYSLAVFKTKLNDSINRLEQVKMQRELMIDQENNLKNLQEQEIKQATPIKKKKRSYLLFLFGITGGGMMIIKLFSKNNKSSTSIV